MSMRLDKRWYDYSDIYKDPRYHCIFKISNKLTDKQVKFLEGKILEKTNESRKDTLGNEYRDTNKISYEDFIKISEEVLKEYDINYIIQYEPIFEKPERMINENTDNIEPEELFKIDDPQPITPPVSPPTSPNLTRQETFNDRQYQLDIIEIGYNILITLFKFYLELATGAGKTYIVFKIFSQLKPDVLFCLSPRLKINKQNISNKYLSILGKDYEVFNLSEDKDIETFMKKDCKKLIVGCYKSYKKVYDIIHKYNIENLAIWFDEAHSHVEKWTEMSDDIEINYLLKNKNIKYRLFTSASPDRDIVNNYENIFGKLISPIKVKELMDLNYLCPLKPMMYYHNSEDVDILKYSLDNFTELKRNWGLSFHNEQNNAKLMFEKHLTLFNNDDTNIKPYLIISDKTEFRTNYNYDKLEEFEKNANSIAYVVRQCDMGYDYSGIDFLIFSDRKMSPKDIIQCIGRGLRPDKLGVNGTNLKKECILLLPVFIDDEIKNKYKKVIEVLRYLILDLEIDVDDLIESNGIAGNSKSKSLNIDYDGLNSIKAELIDLLESSNIINPMNKNRLIKFCINHNIQNQKDYNEFKNLNPYLKLKDNIYEYKDFKWKPIVDPNSEIYYSSIEECEIKKEELFNRLESEKDEDEMDEIYENETDEGFKYLNKLDSKFPPYTDLSYFY